MSSGLASFSRLDAPSISVNLFLGVVSCESPPPPPSKVTSQVLDPLNHVVKSSATVTGSANPFAVKLTFDSGGPGSYHVTLVADESTTQQYDLVVLADASKRPFVDIAGCQPATVFQLTSTGSLICGNKVFHLDGGFDSALPFDQVIAAGDAV